MEHYSAVSMSWDIKSPTATVIGCSMLNSFVVLSPFYGWRKLKLSHTPVWSLSLVSAGTRTLISPSQPWKIFFWLHLNLGYISQHDVVIYGHPNLGFIIICADLAFVDKNFTKMMKKILMYVPLQVLLQLFPVRRATGHPFLVWQCSYFCQSWL